LDDAYNGDLNALLQAFCESFLIANPNPPGFPPQSPGDCATNWRVLKGSCWAYDYAIGVPKASNKTVLKRIKHKAIVFTSYYLAMKMTAVWNIIQFAFNLMGLDILNKPVICHQRILNV
jgi:hypothetical protein